MNIFTSIKDSFANFTGRLGQGANNIISDSSYQFNPITRIRLKLELMYRGSWIAAAAVDLPAEDMTRSGISIEGIPQAEIDRMQEVLIETGTWASLTECLKWGRLFGGALGYVMVDGQEPSTILNVRTIGPGAYKGLMPFDRWQVLPSLSELITDFNAVEYGLPRKYQVVADRTSVMQGQMNYELDHSRVIRFTGIDLPFQQRITEMGWGESVLERLYDRLVSYDSATAGAAQLSYKAHLRILKIPEYRNIVAEGGPALDGLNAQVAHMRLTQSSEGVTVIDGEDEMTAISPSFGGFKDILEIFGEQISGALQIPLTRLFGQSPAGMNATGDSDLITYYDNLSKMQEMRLRQPLHKILEVVYISTFQKPLPAGFRFKFNSLWQMKPEQRAKYTTDSVKAIIDAFTAGLISKETAQKELQHLSELTGMFSHIQEEPK